MMLRTTHSIDLLPKRRQLSEFKQGSDTFCFLCRWKEGATRKVQRWQEGATRKVQRWKEGATRRVHRRFRHQARVLHRPKGSCEGNVLFVLKLCWTPTTIVRDFVVCVLDFVCVWSRLYLVSPRP
jgi:hypothetical protein